ncbi:cupin domain-containing protein [Streptomyces sp. NPDC090493]|uniref:cupin domain-containing protein n=1 Tax=Streptomyces sp. NPDC090493 TaxID=3365964 RepID=UPI00380753B1
MSSSVADYQARRIVTGLDADGRSTIASDENSRTRAVTPTFTCVDVFKLDSVPSAVTVENALTDEVVLQPEPGALTIRMVTFPPDSEWQGSEGYKEAMAAIGSDSLDSEDEIDGLHETDTIDFITMVSGEIWAVLEGKETLLKAGDTLIQRGTKHAWSNRTDGPVTFVATMISATR